MKSEILNTVVVCRVCGLSRLHFFAVVFFVWALQNVSVALTYARCVSRLAVRYYYSLNYKYQPTLFSLLTAFDHEGSLRIITTV